MRQKKSYWCGPTSLKMVLDYLGIRKNSKEIALATQCSADAGVEADSMVKYAESLGLRAFFKDNSTIEELRHYVHEKNIPVIVDWFDSDDSHYSVVVGVNGKYIYVIDPYVGYLKSIKINRFLRIWFDFPGSMIRSTADIYLRRMVVVLPKNGVDKSAEFNINSKSEIIDHTHEQG